MRTKFKIDIIKPGKKVCALVKIIAQHNGGKIPSSIPDLISYVHTQHALWPIKYKGLRMWRNDDNDQVLYFSEDNGHTVTAIIEEIDILGEIVSGRKDDMRDILLDN